MGVINFLDRGYALYPDRLCFVDNAASRTYTECHDRNLKFARALCDAGVTGADRVAVLSPNCSALFEAVLGVYRSGAIYVPLNARNHADENIYILNRTGASTLLYHSEFEAFVQRARREYPAIVRFICIDGKSVSSPSMEAMMATAAAIAPPRSDDPSTVTGIHSTGGTTGKPKGVKLTSLVWDTAAANLFAAMKFAKPPVYLVAAPITHAAGSVAFCMLSQGATIIVHNRFDAGEVLAAIEKHRITHLWLPPTAIYMLLSHPALRQHDYSSLEYFMYAASPISVDKLKECLEVFGPVMAQSFGQTEAPMYCTWLDRDDHAVGDPVRERRLASCGKPMLLTPVEIMDDAGKLLSAGERGEIVVRGNLVMSGYYEDEAATRAAMHNGWLRTGDVGYKDEEGYIFIVDRKKQMIITGGLNVYPSEIEQVILSHAAIQECAVIGVPDEKWGEAIKAIVEKKPGGSVSDVDIIAMCKERLGGVKAPKSVEFWDTIPRTPVGKVDKKTIREKFWKGRERAV
nr:AMP-binding protein [Nitrosomonas nitrosa]